MLASANSKWTTAKRVQIAPLSLGLVAFVTQNMRPLDRLEANATSFSEEPADLAVDVCMHWGPTGAVLGIERPIAVIGATQRWPNVWTAWMFATDEFPRIGKAATRYARDVLLPTVRNVGMVRADARSLASNVAAHRWIELIGGRFESELKGFGKNGEDFVQFRWT